MFRHRHLLAYIENFRTDQNGQVAMLFALLAIPLLVLTSSVMDYAAAEKERAIISAALDDAALAAVTKQNITDAERKAYATEYFWQNIEETENRTLNVVESSSQRVELQAISSVPTSIIAAMGVDDFTVVEDSVGEVTKGEVICMLVLDPESEGSLRITTGARLTSENCSVQVNSRHKRASIVDHGAVAKAKDFCVTGGAVGPYNPHVNTECAAVADPYAALRAPKSGPCINQDELDEELNHHRSKVVPGITLYPGTYCGGLRLKANVVTFAPGTYIIKDGPLDFDDFTRATANDVTFILTGKNAVLVKSLGSKVSVKAPSDGPYAGIGFFQDRFNTGKPAFELPSGNSVIFDGSSLDLTGTGYFPTQHVTIMRGAYSTTRAPATSFITYQMSLRQGVDVNIDADHQEAGLPPILPRSDEGARLAK